MKYPCKMCMERFRCGDGKMECTEFLKYRQQRKNDMEKNRARWKGSQGK